FHRLRPLLGGVHQPAGLHHALRGGAPRRQRECARGSRLPPRAHALRGHQGLGPGLQGRRAGSHAELHQRQDVLLAVAALAAPTASATAASGTRALRIAQCRTLLLLFLGYASCYFCRSNLSVATPLLVDELGHRGVSHADALGTIAAILTCSYLLGDAAARGSMGLLLQRGVGWRGLFLFGASVAGLLFLANLLFLRESRTDEGYPEAIANPRNVFSGAESRPRTFAALVLTLLRSRAFPMVCLLSLATTMLRDAFNTWTPAYMRDFLGFSVSRAAAMSAIFPAVGELVVLLSGWLSDRLGRNCG